ncbi:MAG: MFS transporter, partial [Ignavibacteria bacterium]|nr:MFS transporter [Ignavibacteria bacterium]
MTNSTEDVNKMPKGIPYIIGNELAERFSYYGMKTILVVFMTQYIMNRSGAVDPMSDADATTWYHYFSMANYFFPILGAILSDVLWGKYKTIMTLSIVYVLGHVALAVDDTRLGLSIGLTLIAMGSGGIKPCVSAHVGDQFTRAKKHLLEKIFGYFYFSVNLGAAASSLLTPVLLDTYGPHIAFGVPGFLMLVATMVFYMGRKVFIAVPPVGWKQYKSDIFSK